MIERQSNQGGAAWLKDRAGCATASCFADILATSRDGKPLKAREDYMMKLVVERITGEPIMTPASFAMNWGTDIEPYARAEYEIETGATVREVGFKRHPQHQWVGASSDGLVGESGAIEIKCPHNSAIHLQTWETGMPEHHMAQVQGQIWVLGLDWVDFCSYDPRMQTGAQHLKLYRQRIGRDQKYIDDLEYQVLEFLHEVDRKVQMFLSYGAAA